MLHLFKSITHMRTKTYIYLIKGKIYLERKMGKNVENKWCTNKESRWIIPLCTLQCLNGKFVVANDVLLIAKIPIFFINGKCKLFADVAFEPKLLKKDNDCTTVIKMCRYEFSKCDYMAYVTSVTLLCQTLVFSAGGPSIYGLVSLSAKAIAIKALWHSVADITTSDYVNNITHNYSCSSSFAFFYSFDELEREQSRKAEWYGSGPLKSMKKKISCSAACDFDDGVTNAHFTDICFLIGHIKLPAIDVLVDKQEVNWWVSQYEIMEQRVNDVNMKKADANSLNVSADLWMKSSVNWWVSQYEIMEQRVNDVNMKKADANSLNVSADLWMKSSVSN
ncbi:hypothetical protein EGR_10838 [Echinococcus granulosus]|uniref:Uncharacterized protein n=1 Tax=Echinococcus granulosus TaxID=6210 RepID=W6U1C8_ECHGR|nr:hypothetical protein EGR_10838 [Echinococcus granulosus]EUB54306.1 hypothetical protein EGR_10838 [Echinococcus granulosus]